MKQTKDTYFHVRVTKEEQNVLKEAANEEQLSVADFVREAINKKIKTQSLAMKRIGFTLIELIVTMIIIGILASIATPVFLNQRKAAWKATVQSDVTNAQLVTETATTATNGSIDGMTFKTGTHDSPLEITANGESWKSTISPQNTVTAAIGKTANGAACYVITGKNENVSGYTYQKSSEVDPSDCVTETANTCGTSTDNSDSQNYDCTKESTYDGSLSYTDTSTSITIPYCDITGDLWVGEGVSVSAPNLENLGTKSSDYMIPNSGATEGYLYVGKGASLSVPKLENVGDYIRDARNGEFSYPKLKHVKQMNVGVSSNSSASFPELKAVAFDVLAHYNVSFPKLESVGGTLQFSGKNVNFSQTLPNLKSVDTLYAQVGLTINAPNLTTLTNASTNGTINAPSLTSLHELIIGSTGTFSAEKLETVEGELTNNGILKASALKSVNGKAV